MIQQELREDLHSLTVLLRWLCGQRKKTWAPWFTVTQTGWCESLGGLSSACGGKVKQGAFKITHGQSKREGWRGGAVVGSSILDLGPVCW